MGREALSLIDKDGEGRTGQGRKRNQNAGVGRKRNIPSRNPFSIEKPSKGECRYVKLEEAKPITNILDMRRKERDRQKINAPEKTRQI